MNSKTQQFILDTATTLFLQNGIRATTTDLISHTCGISKKTLYKFFTNKESIVSEIVKSTLEKIEQYTVIVPGISSNAVAELIHFFQFMRKNVYIFTPEFMNDLINYFPDVYKLTLQSRTNNFLPFFCKNVERGIAEGYYRKSVDGLLTGHLYFTQIDNALEDSTKTNEEKLKVLLYINSFFLHAIIQESGVKLLPDHLK